MSSYTSTTPTKPIVIELSSNDDPGTSTSFSPTVPSGSNFTTSYSDTRVPPNRDDQPYGLQIIEPQANIESGDELNPKSLTCYFTYTEAGNLQAPHTSRKSVMVLIPSPSMCSTSGTH